MVARNTVDVVETKERLAFIEMCLCDEDPVYSDIWKLGINTGLRINEFLALTMKDVETLDASNTVLEIKIKTACRRIVLNEEAFQCIKKRLSNYPRDKFLFQSDSPKHQNVRPISAHSFSRVLKKIGDQMVPKMRLSAHSMRKTLAYEMCKSSVDFDTHS